MGELSKGTQPNRTNATPLSESAWEIPQAVLKPPEKCARVPWRLARQGNTEAEEASQVSRPDTTLSAHGKSSLPTALHTGQHHQGLPGILPEDITQSAHGTSHLPTALYPGMAAAVPAPPAPHALPRAPLH